MKNEASDSVEVHSTGDLWNAIHDLSKDAAETNKEVSGLAVGLENLTNKMGELHSLMMGQISRQPDKPNYTGIISSAVGVGVVLGALVMQTIAPIIDDVAALEDDRKDEHTYRLAVAERRGAAIQQLNDLSLRVDQHEKYGHERDAAIAELQAAANAAFENRKAISDVVQSIDERGTRALDSKINNHRSQ